MKNELCSSLMVRTTLDKNIEENCEDDAAAIR